MIKPLRALLRRRWLRRLGYWVSLVGLLGAFVALGSGSAGASPILVPAGTRAPTGGGVVCDVAWWAGTIPTATGAPALTVAGTPEPTVGIAVSGYCALATTGASTVTAGGAGIAVEAAGGDGWPWSQTRGRFGSTPGEYLGSSQTTPALTFTGNFLGGEGGMVVTTKGVHDLTTYAHTVGILLATDYGGPLTVAGYDADLAYAAGINGTECVEVGLPALDAPCVVASATLEPSLSVFLSAVNGGQLQTGVEAPTPYWTGGTVPVPMPVVTTLVCSVTTHATSRAVTFKAAWSPGSEAGVTYAVTLTPAVDATPPITPPSPKDATKSPVTFKVTFPPTTKPAAGATPPGFDGLMLVAATGTGKATTGKSFMSCPVTTTFSLSPGTRSTVGAPGETGTTTTSTSNGSGTVKKSTTLCGAASSWLTRLESLFTPEHDVVCPMEYLFDPSTSAVASWRGLVGVTSSATASHVAKGSLPATAWMYQVGRTAVQAPGDVQHALATSSVGCGVPSVNLTGGAGQELTVCAGVTASKSALTSGGWETYLGDMCGALFSLAMLWSLWFFIARLLSRGAVSSGVGGS